MVWLWVSLIGLVSGVFGSMFGVGGGIIMVPAMVLLLAMPQKTAQGMSLAVMVPMALTAAVRYYLNPATTFNVRQALVMAVLAVVGALLGTYLVTKVPAVVLKKTFAVLMIAVAVKMLVGK
jgi:uncharacterized membrane protein YfcA